VPVLGIISCHPPIIIPEIGGNETKKVQKTIDALKLAASEVEKFNPEVTLIMSTSCSGFEWGKGSSPGYR